MPSMRRSGFGVPMLVAGVLASTIASGAGADIDLTGHFVGTISPQGYACQVDMTQTNGTLAFSGTCAAAGVTAVSFLGNGNVDVHTGTWTATVSVPGFCSGGMVTGQTDGYAFSGAGSGLCNESGSFS